MAPELSEYYPAGPWTISDAFLKNPLKGDKETYVLQVRAADGKLLCTIHDTGYHGAPAFVAALMAGAPEMFEALQKAEISTWAGWRLHGRKVINDAIEAVVKRYTTK